MVESNSRIAIRINKVNAMEKRRLPGAVKNSYIDIMIVQRVEVSCKV